MTTYTPEELDRELARRKEYPSTVEYFSRKEGTTVAQLRAELEATPLTHVEREWRVWELALAERQAVTAPGELFHRIIDLTH